MEVEVEAKFLNIDADALRTKLTAGGAVRSQSERLMRRLNFDYPDKRLEKVGGWVRLRDEGDKVTLAYKQMSDRSLHGTKEISVVVAQFEQTQRFLEAIGLTSFGWQESKRESWNLGEVEVAIDTWPWILTFVELEGPNEQSVMDAAVALGLPWDQALHGSVEIAYRGVYDVTDAEVYSCPEIKFGPVPAWLEAKRRQM